MESLEGRLFLSATWIVSSVSDSATTSGTLRYDINNSAAGDMITFAPSVFPSGTQQTLTLGGAQLEIAHNLTIQGPGSAALFISGNNASRVFEVDPGVAATISGLTITAGNAGSNGGGGIFNDGGTLSISNAVVGSNTARLGGGAYTLSGSISATNCTFLSNTATSYGGGFDCDSGTTATVTGCTFQFDDAPVGGGILDYGISLNVINTTITASAASNGRGGGISNYQGNLTVSDSTIDGNPASQGGGGIYSGAGAVTLNNTIVAQNVLLNTSAPSDILGTVSGSNNLIGDGSGGLSSADHNLVGSASSPLSPGLSAIGNYGGPTQTMPPAASSPVINAGNNSLIPSGVTMDQRGLARIVNGTVDIGACEYTPGQLTINGTSGVDTVTVGASSAGGIMVILNGVETDYAPGGYSSLTVNGGTQQDTINVLSTVAPTTVVINGPSNAYAPGFIHVGSGGLLTAIAQPLTAGGNAQVTLDDSKDASTHHAVFAVGASAQNILHGLSPADITFDAAGGCNVELPASSGNIIDLRQCTSSLRLDDDTSAGGIDTFNIGANGLASPPGNASVVVSEYGQGRESIAIDNSADSRNESMSMGFGPNTSAFEMSGMGGNWSFKSSAISSLLVSGGTGGTAFSGDFLGLSNATATFDGNVAGGSAQVSEVPSTVSITVQAHGGKEAVIADSRGSTGLVDGTVNIENPGGTTTLSIDDTWDTLARSVSFDTSTPVGNTDLWESISGFGAGKISYDAAQMTGTVSITGGTGADSFTILNTPAFPPPSGQADFSISNAGASKSPSFLIDGAGANTVFDLVAPSVSPDGGNFTFDFSGGKISAGSQFNLQGSASLTIRGQHATDAFAIDDPTISFGSVSIRYSTPTLLALGTGTYTLASFDGGSLSIDGSATTAQTGLNAYIANMGTLTISDGARFVESAGQGTTYLTVESLSITTGGELDVQDNLLILADGSGSLPPASVRSWIQSGYNNGSWNGTGIVSSTLPTGAMLGYIVSGADAQIRPTFPGDTNLDETVTLSDLLPLIRNFGQTNATWQQGDYNYDGTVNLSDFLLLSRDFGKNYLFATSPPAESSANVLSSAADDPATRRRRIAVL